MRYRNVSPGSSAPSCYATAIVFWKVNVRSAEKTPKEANDTLTILEEFDKLINLKDEAVKSLQEIPEIQKTIEEARRLTQDARNSLADVVSAARKALDVAREAETKATQASNEAGVIHMKAEDTKGKAGRLGHEAEDLNVEVQNAETAINGHDTQVAQVEELAKKVLLESAASKQRAQDDYNQIIIAHSVVKTIKEELSTLGSVDLSQLQALEKQLDEVEKQLADSDISKKMDELQKKNTLIETQVSRFGMDIDELRATVTSIGDIRDSLPDGCFKTTAIEKPAQ